LNPTEIDESFCREVFEQPGGKKFKECFQCGTCTSSCPVRAVVPSYNPRVLVKMVELGLRRRVLSSGLIWLCTYCRLCGERCPQDVKFPELVTVLRNMAVNAGYTHPSLVKLSSILLEHGRIYEVDDFTNSRRRQLGLPDVPVDKGEWEKFRPLLRLKR
jgi:heterodisulfide reductase subunit C